MRGLFIGRFQPLHLGHVSIMEAALQGVGELVVGIGSAECSHLPRDPFTAGERIEMVNALSRQRGWNDRVIPVPIRDVNRYSIWVSHVLSLCPRIDVVFSNNPLTIRLFSEAGYEVRSTKLVDRHELSGAGIRDRIASEGEWEHLVPEPVLELLKELKGPERIKELIGSGEEK